MENSVTKLLESWPRLVVVVVAAMVPLHARATERGGALLVHTCCEVPLPVRARFLGPRPRLSAARNGSLARPGVWCRAFAAGDVTICLF